ncbi:MAG: AAA family ATPase [Phocaeicola sp.]
MKHFKELIVENFRGFDYIKVEQLGQVNLFLGKNSAGKSTLLEALFLLSGLGDVRHLNGITTLRSEQNNQLNEIVSLFHGFDFEQHPHLQATLESDLPTASSVSEMRKVVITPNYGSLSYPINPGSTKINRTPIGIHSKGSVQVDGEAPNELQGTIQYHGHSPKFKIRATKRANSIDLPEKGNQLEATYLSSGKEEGALLSSYDEVVKKGAKEQLIGLLQQFDVQILGIESIDNRLYLQLMEFKQLLPLTMAGDGLKRFLKIAIAILSSESRILLIDEIDNGLHYAAYPLLWKSLFTLCQEQKMQLFITTHNLELLTALEKVLSQEKEEVQQSLRLYTIEKSKLKGFQAYGYGYEGVKGAIEREIELRS